MIGKMKIKVYWQKRNVATFVWSFTSFRFFLVYLNQVEFQKLNGLFLCDKLTDYEVTMWKKKGSLLTFKILVSFP